LLKDAAAIAASALLPQGYCPRQHIPHSASSFKRNQESRTNRTPSKAKLIQHHNSPHTYNSLACNQDRDSGVSV
jgi:hypothetical protein